MERENIIEDKVSFRYYLEHNHDFVESTKNYGCVHNGVLNSNIRCIEMSLHKKHQQRGSLLNSNIRCIEICDSAMSTINALVE